MKKINFLIAGIILVAVIIIGIAGTGFLTLDQKDEYIKIGFVGPLSGDLAFIGNGAQNAFTLVESERENTKYKYKFIFEDDQFDLKTASTVTTKLINIDDVDSIISLFSGTGLVVSKLADESQVLHIAIASEPDIAEGELNFVHWTPVETEAKVYVDKLIEDNINKISFFISNNSGTKLYFDYVKEYITENTNIEITNEFFINPNERDFRTVLNRVKNDDSEMVAFFAMSPKLEFLAKQYKELGIEKPISSIGGIFETSQQMDLFEGNWYINSAEPNQNYINKYKEVFNESPPPGSAHVYDALNLIIDSYENSGRDNLLASDYLKQIDNYYGVLGYLNVLSTGIIDSDAIVKVIRDGTAMVLN